MSRTHRASRALAVAAVALLGGTATLHAQLTCRSAASEAIASINRTLAMPEDAAWFGAHGITATDASTLTQLTVASDAALCARIDSSFARGPISAFRAGAYVIATDRPVAADPVTGKVPLRETPHVLVFDSLGAFVYLPGTGVGAAAPLDVRAATATAGEVRIAWRNQFTHAVSHQLQRAVGSGSFSDLGSTLSTTDTTASDATASDSTTYRYRVAAIAADATRGYSEAITVAVANPGPVTRPTTGLLFRDQFNRANGAPGADWVAEAGTWTITNNALQVVAGQGANSYLRLANLTNRKDFHVQVLVSRANLLTYSTVLLRRVGGTYYMGDLGSFNEGNKPRMHRWVNGGYAGLGYGTFASTVNTAHRITFSVIGGGEKLWADGLLQVTASDANAANDINGGVTLNVYGLGGDGTTRYDDLVVNASRTVAVAGLPTGYRLRVAGLVSTRSTGAGDVTIDLQGTELPVARVEILNQFDVMVKAFTPSDGVWGGDRYSFNGAP